jgi:hypothetical protein
MAHQAGYYQQQQGVYDVSDSGYSSTPQMMNGSDVSSSDPSSSLDTQDELAVFVARDKDRLDRLRKKYEDPGGGDGGEDGGGNEEDDDDGGFSRRPSVRGIKPKFGSTTEILQQLQNEMVGGNPNVMASYGQQVTQSGGQQITPGHTMTWPYGMMPGEVCPLMPTFSVLCCRMIRGCVRLYTPDHLLLDSAPNLGPLISCHEINKFKNC